MSKTSLNHVFRLVWSHVQGRMVVVPETQRSRGKAGGAAARMAAVILGGGLLSSVHAADLPTGGRVVAGASSINQNGATLTVNQTSSKVAIDWQSFNIGQGNTVNFVQPSTGAVAFNRVLGSDVSVIQGALHANGQVFLVNPNGVLFTPTAQVNVGSIVASTLNMSTDNFMAGNYAFSGSSSNAIINQGNITATGDNGKGGTIALIAAKVSNVGQLTAAGGNVLLGAGSTVELDLGGPVKLLVEQGAIDALIEQGGAIRANGGLVYLSAKAAGELANTVIKHTGITEAQTLATGETGQIVLLGGMEKDRIEVGGTLDASAPHGGRGGAIETSASDVKISGGTKIKAGHWLIDPTDVNIDANMAAALESQLATGDASVITGITGTDQGNITVSAPISWSSNSWLALAAHNNIYINANITASAGGLALAYGLGASATNNTSFYRLGNGAKVSLPAGLNFETQQGSDGTPIDWTVITSLGTAGSTTGTDLQGLASVDAAGHFVLGADIDASDTRNWNNGAGFKPIVGQTITLGYANMRSFSYPPVYLSQAQYDALPATTNYSSYPTIYGKDAYSLATNTPNFSGTLDGLGHTIDHLYINRPTENTVGLFPTTGAGAEIRSLGLTHIDVTGASYVGGLVGEAREVTIKNSYSSGTVVTQNPGAGGLVGHLNGGQIEGSYSDAAVTANDGGWVGGLVGQMSDGAITNSHANGNVTANRTSGSVGDWNHRWVGGLVGLVENGGVISNSYAAGNVSATTADSVGGLIGSNWGGSQISDAYATGNVTGNDYVGGLIGQIGYGSNAISRTYSVGTVSATGTHKGGLISDVSNTSTVVDSFWDTETSGQSTSAAGAGKTTAEMKTPTTYSGANWTIEGVGGTYPIFVNGGWYIGPVATPIYLRLLGGSSIYGDAMNLTYGLFDSASGGNAVTDAQATGSVSWLGLPSQTPNVGTYSLTYGSGITLGTSSYTLAAGGAVDWVITRRPITVTADAKSKVYGTADPVLTYQVTAGNLVGNDSLGSLTRTSGENVGNYTIDTSTLTNGNYLITANNGVLSISQRPVTVTADAKTKVYGETDPVLTYTVSSGSMVGNDSLGSLTRAAGENVGNYTIDASTLTNGNYLITANNGVLSISQRPITVTTDAKNKVYGTADPVLTYQVTAGNLVGNDNLTLTRSVGENAGSYNISAPADANGNYLITANNGVLTISQRQVTVTADTKTKVYGEADPALTYTISGDPMVGNDSLGRLTRTGGENVGNYTIDASTLTNGNYLITSQNGVLTILPVVASNATAFTVVSTPVAAAVKPRMSFLTKVVTSLAAAAENLLQNDAN